MELICRLMRSIKMSEPFFSAKLVCLLTLLSYSTLASPVSFDALRNLNPGPFSSSSSSGFGSHQFEDTTESQATSTATESNKPSGTGESSAKILNYNNDNDGLGSYKFEYDTENRIHRAEEGNLRQIGDEAAIAATGSYKYFGPNGEEVSVVYVADENGYKPKVYITLLPKPAKPAKPPIATVEYAVIASAVG